MIEELYASYLKEMKRLKATPPFMSIKQFADSQGIALEEEVEPLVLTPRNAQLPMKPTLDNHITMSGRSRILNNEAVKRKRAEYKSQGLTSNGKPYKVAV